jgi:transposase
MAGRNSKLTPLVQERIVVAVRAGNYAAVAAAYAGISERTFYSWLTRGENESSGKYREFADAVNRAEAEAEAEAVAQVRLASRDNWAAAMTWLERKYPRRWGRFDRQEVAGEVTIRIVDETSDKLFDSLK